MPDVYTKAPVKKGLNGLTPQGGSLSAFAVLPKDIRFETQEANEEIVIFLRQHVIVNAGWIFASIILALLPTIVEILLSGTNLLPTLPAGYYVVIPALWYLGLFGYIFVSFLHWYFNIYIVTNERVVDIDWVSLLYKHFASTRLDKVQDVSYKQACILDLFFNFGHVYIQTAGSEQNFEFAAVPKPDLIVRQINELVEEKNGHSL